MKMKKKKMPPMDGDKGLTAKKGAMPKKGRQAPPKKKRPM